MRFEARGCLHVRARSSGARELVSGRGAIVRARMADACAFVRERVVWVWVVSKCRMAPDLVVGGHSGMLCSAVSYSPTPCRVQYHRRWRA